MATQLQLLANKKVQYIRKGTLADLVCIKDNSKTCTWQCLGMPEPVVVDTFTVINFACGSYPLQLVVPTTDFVDSR
jgi:hypothetical protein